MEYVVKRDGTHAPFDETRIKSSLSAALFASDSQYTPQSLRDMSEGVLRLLCDRGFVRPGVGDVEDASEEILMRHGYYGAAKAYILYRANRMSIKTMERGLMDVYEELTCKRAAQDDAKRENANIDGDSAMGTMLKYGSEGAKFFNKLYVLKPEAASAHESGDIHIHDLDFLTLTMTCCQIDLQKLFRGGFGTGHGTIREPGGIRSAASLTCIALQANQNDQHGGQSIPLFDYYLAPYVTKTFGKLFHERLRANLASAAAPCRFANDAAWEAHAEAERSLGEKFAVMGKDFLPNAARPDCDVESLTYAVDAMLADGPYDALRADRAALARIVGDAKDRAWEETDAATFQAMEALVHNLNTMHSRAGAQVPFTSLNFGTDTSPEGRMVTKNLLLAVKAGLGRHETAIFPITIFKVKKGVNSEPGDPNRDLFDLACAVSAERLFPNFAFLDAPFNAQYLEEGRPDTEAAYMGCRTRVMGNVYDPEREIVTGRGNLSFTSVNLPRLALRADHDESRFFDLLDSVLPLVERQLLDRFAIQSRKRVRNFPFLMGQGVWLDSERLGPDDLVGEVLKHGTLSIGFIGLAEALTALCGSHHGESDEAQELGLRIVGAMRRFADEASARHGLNFSLLATPAEGLAGRFLRLDRKLFGTVTGVTDKEYYTNSFHIPVGFPIIAYEKIRREAPYHALTNGGHITYIELDGNPARNVAAFQKLVLAMRDAGIGYGAINHPLDRDPVCGYTGVIDDTCPGCGRTDDEGPKFERIRRITGYLVGTLDRFNDAKRAEEHDRVHHLGAVTGQF